MKWCVKKIKLKENFLVERIRECGDGLDLERKDEDRIARKGVEGGSNKAGAGKTGGARQCARDRRAMVFLYTHAY